MFRKLHKKHVLPRRWKKDWEHRVRSTEVRESREILEKIKQKQLEYHTKLRQRQMKEAQQLEGYVEALKWVCLDQNESKQ